MVAGYLQSGFQKTNEKFFPEELLSSRFILKTMLEHPIFCQIPQRKLAGTL